MRKLDCGCLYFIDAKWGVERVIRCHSHAESSIHEDENYYLRTKPSAKIHEEELLTYLPNCLKGVTSILEIGSGWGTYIPLFLKNGLQYLGIEASKVACEHIGRTYNVPMLNEKVGVVSPSELIFSAHTFEHLENSPEILAGIKTKRLVLVLPYGPDDYYNPQHLWFYTDESLRTLLEQIGYKEIEIKVASISKIERFIYCQAE